MSRDPTATEEANTLPSLCPRRVTCYYENGIQENSSRARTILMTVAYRHEGTFLAAWIYPDVVRYIWYWMKVFPWSVDSLLWFIMQSITFLYLTNRLIESIQ